MRKKTMFLGMLGAGMMWMPTSAILAAQMNNAATMSAQRWNDRFGQANWCEHVDLECCLPQGVVKINERVPGIKQGGVVDQTVNPAVPLQDFGDDDVRCRRVG